MLRILFAFFCPSSSGLQLFRFLQFQSTRKHELKFIFVRRRTKTINLQLFRRRLSSTLSSKHGPERRHRLDAKHDRVAVDRKE